MLRLLEGQETCNGEMNITHKICRKIQLVKSRSGLIYKERLYEGEDLCFIIFSVEINKVRVFATSLRVPLHITHRAPSFCVLKLFENLSHFLRSHSDLTSVTLHAAAAVRV